MNTTIGKSTGVILLLVTSLAAAASQAAAVGPHSVFDGFTAHIEQQVELDKRVFVAASACTEWFYKEKRRKPSGPSVQGVAYAREPGTFLLLDPSVNCRARYPGGLDAARKDFSKTQSTLSLSLTFYEFALVADRDDDERYSDDELQDTLGSMGLPFRPGLPAAGRLSMLNMHFDTIHTQGQFDLLMSGMTGLLDKGYRFTDHDKVALNRVMG